jgi:regulator of RNase E activity RraA
MPCSASLSFTKPSISAWGVTLAPTFKVTGSAAVLADGAVLSVGDVLEVEGAPAFVFELLPEHPAKRAITRTNAKIIDTVFFMMNFSF